ncbi:MAG: hypothetical protein QW461_10740 [Candidatus Jordarchaeales archaeon]
MVRNVDVSKLDEDSRYKVLYYLVEKCERKKVVEEVGISRVTLWGLLRREFPVKPEYIAPLLQLLIPNEFKSLVSVGNRLRPLGISRDDETVDYSLILEIVSIARSDEYLKNAILRFVVQEFKEDIRKMLEENNRKPQLINESVFKIGKLVVILQKIKVEDEHF